MVYRLYVELISGMYMPKGKVTRTLDVAGSCNLEKLCMDILGSIDFDFDHMYQFTFPGRKTFEGTPNLSAKSACRNTKLFSMNLKVKDIFRLVYDFGDDWMFNITVKEIFDKPGAETVVVRRVGKVEQYPGFEDWDEESYDDWDEDMDEDFLDDDSFEDGKFYDDDDFAGPISFDYKAPDKLYDIAFRYKKSKLWTKLWSSEIVALKFSNGEQGYLCVMGKDGQHCAIGVFVGDDGLRSLRSLSFEDPLEDLYEEQERVLQQNCLQLVLDNKEYLQDSEIDAAADYARRNGIRLSGRNAYPHFVKFSPNRYPWHPEKELEEEYIYEAARASLFLADLLKDKKPFEIGIGQFMPMTEELLCLEVSKKEVRITNRVVLPKPVPQVYVSPAPGNAVMLKKAQKLKHKLNLSCKIARSPASVMLGDGSAPYYPLIVFMMDEKTDKIYLPETLQQFEDDTSAAADQFISRMIENGFLPKKINVCDIRTKAFLSEIAKALEIEIVMKKSLPKLEQQLADMLDAIGADNGNDANAEYEMLLAIAQNVIDMPASVVRNMPGEIREELIKLIDEGIFPVELTEKLSKKLGKH